MGNRQNVGQRKTWTQKLETEYQECDCLVFLLTGESLISELMTEGLKRAISIRQSRQNPKPLIIAVRVNLGFNAPISPELEYYVNQIQQWQWYSQKDTRVIIEKILHQLSQLSTQLLTASESSVFSHQLYKIQQPLKTVFSPREVQPLPFTKPELPDASNSSTSPFYIERIPYQQQSYQAIVKPGALIRICAPRQRGKTSLLNRILAYAAAQNYHTVLLDFQQLDKSILSNLEVLLRWFCLSIARQLNLSPNLDEYWDEDIGVKASSTVYLQSYLLSVIENPIVIALEEVSEIFDHIALTQDFFTLLRSWHEKSKVNSTWAKMRLVMVQSTDTYIPININQSPLNVGLGINLPGFSVEEVQVLVKKHQLRLTPTQIGQLMELLEGHPYLIRLTLYHLSQRKITFTRLLETATTDVGIYSDHLHTLLWKLQQEQDLAKAFRQVLFSSSPVQLDYHQGFKLKYLGLVSLDNEQYTVSCNLYRLYFQERLGL